MNEINSDIAPSALSETVATPSKPLMEQLRPGSDLHDKLKQHILRLLERLRAADVVVL
ncbi:MAG: hypothetical protein HC883_00610 [Bdellovibrionaceae bacterium]|nr:hypothetical protein [Pseudobdellovibrionaceae bacterium]